MNDKIEQIMNLFERVRAYGYGYEAEETLSEIRAALESLAGGEAVIQFRHPQWPNKEQWHDCNEKELAKLRLFGMEFRTLYTTPPATVPQAEHEALKAAYRKAMGAACGMVNPHNPHGQPGSYMRGEYNGIVAVINHFREAFAAALSTNPADEVNP